MGERSRTEPLVERVAEAIRVHRFGLIRPLWADLAADDERRLSAMKSAQDFIKICRRRGVNLYLSRPTGKD